MGQKGFRGVDFAFLDSGTGGIPYMMELKNKMPAARCVYIGDTAHFPYGEKSASEVTESAAASIAEIVRRWEPETLVIACNTISVTSLDELRRRFPALPIVGTVPAIRLAARVSRNKRIGLLATNATVRHPYCEDLVRNYASDCEIFKRGDPDLISFIEHALFTASEAEKMEAVRPAVSYFLEENCDTIILGCTHFTHVASYIQNAAGDGVQVVDSRDGVSKQAMKVWYAKGESDGEAALPYMTGLPGDMSFFVTLLRSPEDETEYCDLCASFRIPWGGEIRI
jgi:glutamate racemase